MKDALINITNESMDNSTSNYSFFNVLFEMVFSKYSLHNMKYHSSFPFSVIKSTELIICMILNILHRTTKNVFIRLTYYVI
jgi:hypothetical protein